MKISIPKEIKPDEHRVAMTPAGVHTLISNGHTVYVQSNAGTSSFFSDEAYKQAGAEILTTAEDMYNAGELIVKVKEPIDSEYKLITSKHILFTYFHFASSRTLTNAMIESNAVCIAYETVELENRQLPLLIPMSEVAGRMSIQEGAKYIEKPQQGKGILLGGVPGVRPAKVLVIGGGIVGTHAALIAAGLGADVTVLDISLPRLRYLSEIMPANVNTLCSNQYTIMEEVKSSDLIIGSVLIPGAKAPNLIKRDMLKTMQKGTVIVDIAVDQGGCVETTHPTTHKDPIFIIDDVVHYCVANMPGAVPCTSTTALTNATQPYVLKIADLGWENAIQQDTALKKGLNIVRGEVLHSGVKQAFGL